MGWSSFKASHQVCIASQNNNSQSKHVMNLKKKYDVQDSKYGVTEQIWA